MSEPIEARAVAISLMREALSLLDDDDLAMAAEHLHQAIQAVEDADADAAL